MLSNESKIRGFHKPPMLSAKAKLGGLRNEKNKGVRNVFEVILAKKEMVKRILS
jgi:hypothetical protein